jgi:hypothetical protein
MNDVKLDHVRATLGTRVSKRCSTAKMAAIFQPGRISSQR